MSLSWGYDSIPLIDGLLDCRVSMLVAFVWALLATLVHACRGTPAPCATTDEGKAFEWRQQRLSTLAATLLRCSMFAVSFIMSSNLFITVGTAKAERLLYLPSLGWTAFVSWLLLDHFASPIPMPTTIPTTIPSSTESKGKDNKNIADKKRNIADDAEASKEVKPPLSVSQKTPHHSGHSGHRFSCADLLVFVFVLLLGAYGGATLIRCQQWSSAETLWENAVRTGPTDVHAMSILARKQIARGDFSAALETLEPLAVIEPPPVWGGPFLMTLAQYELVLRQSGMDAEALMYERQKQTLAKKYCALSYREQWCGEFDGKE